MCDERFEALTLIQTKKIVDFPLILMGKAYWTLILDFFSQMVQEETMSASDLTLLLLPDSIEEAAMLHPVRSNTLACIGELCRAGLTSSGNKAARQRLPSRLL